VLNYYLVSERRDLAFEKIREVDLLCFIIISATVTQDILPIIISR
jgi:hypothetical protein